MEILHACFFLIIIPLLSLFLLDLLSKKLSRLPPGPTPLPLVGNLHLMIGSTHPHLKLAEIATRYGPIFTIHLGRITTVVISSLELIEEALHKNDQSLANHMMPDAVRGQGHGDHTAVWLRPEAEWRRLRALYSKNIFSQSGMEASRELVKKKVARLAASVSEAGKAGRTVRFRHLVHATLTNIIANIEFSSDLVDIDSERVVEFQELAQQLVVESSKPNLSDFFPPVRYFDFQGIRTRSENCMKRLHGIFDPIIIQRRLVRAASPDPVRNNDFLDALLDHQQEQKKLGDDGFTDHAIKTIFSELFIASTHTTSSTLEWVMSELMRNPEIMAKVRAELKQVVGHEREVDDSDMINLPYLRAVMKETFRLHPPGPFILPREALSDIKIGGFTIPKGTQVLVNNWVISQNGRIFEKPTQFIPERFLGSTVDYRGQHFELIPFGTGRRMCPGIPVAERKMFLVLATLIHSFSWKLPGEMEAKDLDMRDQFGISLEKVDPLIVLPIILQNGEAK